MKHKKESSRLTTSFPRGGNVMRRIRFLIGMVCIFAMFAGSAFAGDVFVRGHFRSNGTYVQPHYRSAPDSQRWNNYSYPGNVNPYTGRRAPGSNNPRYNYPSNPNPYDSYPRINRQRRSAYGDWGLICAEGHKSGLNSWRGIWPPPRMYI